MRLGFDPRVPLQIAIAGAQGRMGLAVAEAALQRDGLDVVGQFDRPDSDSDSRTEEVILQKAQVVVDFSTPDASADLARRCAAQGGPALVIGATGFTPANDAEVRRAAERIAIVKSGNFSLGVNVLLSLVRQAAKALPVSGYDIEIFEAHHRRKVDAPSGTALMLGESAAAGREVVLEQVAVGARNGVSGPRTAGTIGFSVMRGGGLVGEHSVVFAADDEILTLSHSARDRSLFARGAIEAAIWVAQQPPGLYDMQDVLGLS